MKSVFHLQILTTIVVLCAGSFAVNFADLTSEKQEALPDESVKVSQSADESEEQGASMVEEIITNPIVAILGWVVGLFSGTLQIMTHFRDRKAQRYLFEKAKLELKGTYNKAQIRELSIVVRNLEAQIRNDLPRLAKKIIRNKQKTEIAMQIANYYSDYKRLITDEDNNEIILDGHISAAIENEILGNLSFSDKRKNILSYFVAGISLLVIISLFIFVERYTSIEFIILDTIEEIIGRFNFLQVGLYAISILLIILGAREIEVRGLIGNSRIIRSRLSMYAFYLIWVLMLFEVYFEPIYLGKTWSIIGAIVSLFPFAFAQIVRKNTKRSKVEI